MYVTNAGRSTISEYAVGPGGALAPSGTISESGLGMPEGIAVTPNSRNVYMASESSDTVWHFNNVNGSLQQLPTNPEFAAGSGPRGVAVTPTAKTSTSATRSPAPCPNTRSPPMGR